MQLTPRVLPALVAAGALMSGCGQSSGAGGTAGNANALAGKSANDIVLAASKSASGSFRFTLSGKLMGDTGGLHDATPEMLKSFGSLASGITFDAKGQEESPKRLAVDVSLSGSPTPIREISYDGETFISTDGGKHFTTANSLSSATNGISATPDAILQLLTSMPGARDLGRTTQDGVDVQHIQTPLDQSLISKALGNGTSSGQDAAIAKFITVSGGAVDVYARRDTGQLESLTVHGTFALDLGGLFRQFAGGVTPGGTAGPSGSVVFTLDDVARFADYGAAITISKPAVTSAGATPGG